MTLRIATNNAIARAATVTASSTAGTLAASNLLVDEKSLVEPDLRHGCGRDADAGLEQHASAQRRRRLADQYRAAHAQAGLALVEPARERPRQPGGRAARLGLEHAGAGVVLRRQRGRQSG